MDRRKAELLAETQAGARDWLEHCDVWQRVEQTTSAFVEILRHFSSPVEGQRDRTPALVAVRLARVAEVSRAWRAAASSDLVWRTAAEAALQQRFPLLISMKLRPECRTTWKELCVRYIAVSTGGGKVSPNEPAQCDSSRADYLVGLTVEQQTHGSISVEPTVLLTSLVDVAGPDCASDGRSRDLLVSADCPVNRPVFQWSDLDNQRIVVTRHNIANPGALRVSIVLMRKHDGKLCPLATTDTVITDHAAVNRTKDRLGVVRTNVECKGVFMLPPMLGGCRHAIGQPRPPFVGFLGSTMHIKVEPCELCTCQPADFHLDKTSVDAMCLCGCAPRWSLERVEAFIDKDWSDPRCELALQSLSLTTRPPAVYTVDDILCVLQSPTAEHRWV